MFLMKQTASYFVRHIYLVGFLILLSALYVLSSMPNITTHTIIPDLILKNIVHVCIFFLLGSLYLKAVAKTKIKWLVNILVYMFIGLVLSGLDEHLQSFEPSRNVSYIDMALDLGGFLAAFVFFKLVKRDQSEEANLPKKKVLLVSSKETADNLFDYCFNQTNAYYDIQKILIWDSYALEKDNVKNRFYSSFEEIYQTVYYERWDKIIFIGDTHNEQKEKIVKDLAGKTDTEVVFIESEK
jgi:VanZ family protein